MRCSVIICTRNQAANLGLTLASMAAVAVPDGLELEIVIADNGSTDATAGVARGARIKNGSVKYVFEPRPGKGHALNTALGQAGGQIIAFTDDDLRFPGSWLQTMCEPLASGAADAVAGSVDLAPHLQRPWMTWLHRAWLASSDRLDPVAPVDMVGANMAFSRAVLDVVPFFDPELGPGASGFGEETLFSLQLGKAGKKIRRAHGPSAVHWFDEKRLERASWLRAANSMGRSRAYIEHHWLHEDVSAATARRLMRKSMAYGAARLFKGRDCRGREGAPEWELVCLENIHRLRARFALSGRPRHYALEGLLKIGGVLPPALAARRENSPAAALP